MSLKRLSTLSFVCFFFGRMNRGSFFSRSSCSSVVILSSPAVRRRGPPANSGGMDLPENRILAWSAAGFGAGALLMSRYRANAAGT